MENGVNIARITNGSKPACHWHTHLYPRKAQVPNTESFYVGTLGEFARSYYFDKGIAGILLDVYGVHGQEVFWSSKLKRHRTFKDSEIDLLTPELAAELDGGGQLYRSKRNARLSDGGVLTGGSRYYLEQRVPNFYANGITMYNDTTQWRSPFHNIEWLKIIWNLSDNWKLGSNWHRLAIKRNFPKLLSFSEEKGFMQERMLSKAPPLYWLSIMQRMKYKSYDLSDEWYRSKKIREFILDNKESVGDICERVLVERVLDEHQNGINRVRAISFLLTMIYFKKALKNG
jgi:asparagine synthase (glutamine-hydrolysing)